LVYFADAEEEAYVVNEVSKRYKRMSFWIGLNKLDDPAGNRYRWQWRDMCVSMRAEATECAHCTIMQYCNRRKFKLIKLRYNPININANINANINTNIL